MKKLLGTLWCISLISPISAQSPDPKRVTTLTGNIKRHEGFRSEVLKNQRNILVYLPPNYDSEPKRRYPVLYMHDGQNVFDGMTSYIPNGEWRADETAEGLIRAGLIEPIIIVAIDNGGMARADEYLPTQMTQRDGSKWGGDSDGYAKMLIEEVKPLIDRTYRTKKDSANTALAGSSFGGIATLYIGTTHPETFSKLGVFSPSLWWDSGVMIRRVRSLKGKPARKVWVDMGTAEGADSVALTLSLQKELVGKGYQNGKDLAVYVDGFAQHNEAAWASRFGAFLLFTFGKK